MPLENFPNLGKILHFSPSIPILENGIENLLDKKNLKFSKKTNINVYRKVLEIALRGRIRAE